MVLTKLFVYVYRVYIRALYYRTNISRGHHYVTVIALVNMNNGIERSYGISDVKHRTFLSCLSYQAYFIRSFDRNVIELF